MALARAVSPAATAAEGMQSNTATTAVAAWRRRARGEGIIRADSRDMISPGSENGALLAELLEQSGTGRVKASRGWAARQRGQLLDILLAAGRLRLQQRQSRGRMQCRYGEV